MQGEGGVGRCLEAFGLQRYAANFVHEGFDQLQDIFCLDDEDLDKLIPDEEMKDQYKTALQQESTLVQQWLNSLGLAQYNAQFQASGYSTLVHCSRLTFQSLDSMHILLPGHRKRLVRAALGLQRNKKPKVMAVGAWDEHAQLRGGRFGKFLCLTAAIHAGDPRDIPTTEQSTGPLSRKVKFMIDSGSDSVTLYDDIIKELQLPVIGCVTQEVPGGISRKIPLYSAFLLIGGKGIKIEVVPDKVNTLGTPVLWEFHHIIDDTKHMWFDKVVTE